MDVEKFRNGKEYTHPKYSGYVFKYDKDSSIVSITNFSSNVSFCSVKKLTTNGFHWEARRHLKTIKGFTEFSECIEANKKVNPPLSEVALCTTLKLIE